MFIMKLALLTCVFYLTVALFVQAAEIVAARVTGGLTISSALWTIFFGLDWIISFGLAWHILARPTG